MKAETFQRAGRVLFFRLWIKRNFRILLPMAYISGCVLGYEFSFPLEYIALTGLVFSIVFFSPKLVLLTILICLGFLRTKAYTEINSRHIAAYLGNQAVLSGQVAEFPYTKGQESVLILNPEKIKIDTTEFPIEAGLVQLQLSKYLAIEKGDFLIIDAVLTEPEIFEDFDYKAYLKTENIYALAPRPKLLEHSKPENGWEKSVNAVRAKIVAAINQSLPDPHAKLLAGMIIGSREEFSEEFKTSLSVSGTSHVVAVSGYNIALIITTIVGFSGIINRRKLLFSCYFLVLVFLAIVGFDNLPALRAGLMGFVTITGFLTGRKGAGMFVLILVAGLMSVQNPLVYKSLSFQLSFLATFGLMCLTDTVTILLSRILPKFLVEEASTTFTAIFVTFPVTFFNFGTFGTYSLFANILIAPLIPIISFLGIIWLIVKAFLPGLGFFVSTIVWASLEIMVKIIEKIVALPFSSYSHQGDTKSLSFAVLLILLVVLFEGSYGNYLRKNA